ncbi:MAG: hypothetical protein Q4C30_09000 [Bacteroidia bacterium]|nr:hypothetical protein [Bacteroidia bacterium]
MKTYTIFSLLLFFCLSSCTESIQNASQINSLPNIYPDYAGVTIPVNIAPLNFSVVDSGVSRIDVRISNSSNSQIHSQGSQYSNINISDWQNILSQSVGDSLRVEVSTKRNSEWESYLPFYIYVSPDSIDYGIVYRLIEPGYSAYSKMGIYESCLSNGQQSALIENTQFQGCVNCHSFNQGNPSSMSLHVRGPQGATLLQLNGKIEAYNTTTSQTLGSCVYPYWHPSGRYIAYSTNNTQQVFHVQNPKRIEVYDQASDLQVYDTKTNQLLITPILMRKDALETFPAFSADGRTLYFCSADSKAVDANDFENIRYNLCSISFNPESGTFGDHIDTLVNAAAEGKSISFPRPSYDGRFLVYTMSNYGQFSIWHPEADLYIMDLLSGSSLPMSTINSNNTESYHSWSSNSKWLVFSSRRDDGLFTRPYFTHINQNGTQSKPFLLPQQNPRDFYRDLFFSYNVPEFITSPTNFNTPQAIKALNTPTRNSMPPTYK